MRPNLSFFDETRFNESTIAGPFGVAAAVFGAFTVVVVVVAEDPARGVRYEGEMRECMPPLLTELPRSLRQANANRTHI